MNIPMGCLVSVNSDGLAVLADRQSDFRVIGVALADSKDGAVKVATHGSVITLPVGPHTIQDEIQSLIRMISRMEALLESAVAVDQMPAYIDALHVAIEALEISLHDMQRAADAMVPT